MHSTSSLLHQLRIDRDEASSVQTPSVQTGTVPVATAALDTSGYVVARRQATVSSKATGRVAEANLDAARIAAEDAHPIFQRNEQQHARGLISSQAFDEIVSPLSASSGFARTGIGTIVDMESMEVEVDVSESFIALVHPGQDALVRLNAYPDLDIAAETVAVVPAVDRSKATVRVRVRFKRKDPRILPDMGVKVTFLGA